MAPTVQVVGATELRLAFGRLDALAADPTTAAAAAELVASRARDLVPVLSGALQATIGVQPAQPAADVVAGSLSVPYAGVQEYGWPARGIEGRHYLEDAADDEADDVVELYGDHIVKVVNSPI